MNTKPLFANAALLALFAIAAPAHSQILGGQVAGSLGGSIAGGVGGLGGLESSIGADTGVIEEAARAAKKSAGKAREVKSWAADKVAEPRDSAKSATRTGAQVGVQTAASATRAVGGQVNGIASTASTASAAPVETAVSTEGTLAPSGATPSEPVSLSVDAAASAESSASVQHR